MGADESTKMYLIVGVRNGVAEVVIEKTFTERYPVQELAKVADLFDRLTCASGRKAWSLEELAHPYNPNNSG